MCWGREGRGQGPEKEPALPRAAAYTRDGQRFPPEADRSLSLPFTSDRTRYWTARGLILLLPPLSMKGTEVCGLGSPMFSTSPVVTAGARWETGGLGGTVGSLELAEDVCIFCGDAGGLQDRHTESEDAAQLQVVQSCLQGPVWRGLLRTVQEKVLRGHCGEGGASQQGSGVPLLAPASSPAPGQRGQAQVAGCWGGGALPRCLSAPPHLRRCCC